MADNIIDLSTAGVAVGYAVEATAGTRPTTGYKAIIGIKSIPEINSQPETLDTTTLAATEYKTSINGLKDLGGALAFGANLTEAGHTQWKEIYQAWETAKAAGKSMWFTIYMPGISEAIFFTGEPSTPGVSAVEVNNVLETTRYITPTNEPDWYAAVTLDAGDE